MKKFAAAAIAIAAVFGLSAHGQTESQTLAQTEIAPAAAAVEPVKEAVVAKQAESPEPVAQPVASPVSQPTADDGAAAAEKKAAATEVRAEAAEKKAAAAEARAEAAEKKAAAAQADADAAAAAAEADKPVYKGCAYVENGNMAERPHGWSKTERVNRTGSMDNGVYTPDKSYDVVTTTCNDGEFEQTTVEHRKG